MSIIFCNIFGIIFKKCYNFIWINGGLMKVNQIVSDFLESNTFVIIEEGEALIVDAGASLEKVKKTVGNNVVVGILLTHGHYDHCFYVLDYIKEFGCSAFIHEHGIKTLANSNLNYGENFSIKDSTNFKTIKNDCGIKLGHYEIDVFATPGHSPCCVSYLIENDLFAGDAVFYHGIGRTDLAESNNHDMLQSLKKISTLKFTRLHSGHSLDSAYEDQQRNLNAYIKFLSRKKDVE